MVEPIPGAVVVGYDGSAHAGAAVDWAAAEAGRRHLPLHVLYAADYPGLVPGPVGGSPWLPERAVEAAEEVTAEGVARARKTAPEVQTTWATMVGSASGTLVDASARASLVVVGTRGHGQLAGSLLGSVAFAVSAHARCPVVVVRGDGATSPGPDRPVVVGVDGSPAAAAALDYAADVAARSSAPLVVLAAWQMAAAETWEAAYWTSVEPGSEPGEAARRAAVDVVDGAAARARDRHAGLQTRTEVVDGPAGRALSGASSGAGLLVVGARGRGGFTGLLLGSVSHAVIHGSSCPVAVVHAGPDAAAAG